MSQPNLEYVSCPTANCGGQWLPASNVQQLRDSHKTFFCPSGHAQWFTGKSEAEKLKEELAKMTKERDHWIHEYERVSQENHQERRRRYALKGAITRLKKAS